MRLVRPSLVRALLRSVAALVAIPVLARAVALLAASSREAAALDEAARLAQASFGVAGVALIAALVLTRGIAKSAGVAVDKRMVYVGTALKYRRIPRWQVDSATVRPPDRRTVEARLGTGEIFHLRVTDEAEARSLAAILAAAPRRRRSDDD